MTYKTKINQQFKNAFLDAYNRKTPVGTADAVTLNGLNSDIINKLNFEVDYELGGGKLIMRYDFNHKTFELYRFYSKSNDNRERGNNWRKGFGKNYLLAVLKCANKLKNKYFRNTEYTMLIGTEYTCPIKLLHYYYGFMRKITFFDAYHKAFHLENELEGCIRRLEGICNETKEQRENRLIDELMLDDTRTLITEIEKLWSNWIKEEMTYYTDETSPDYFNDCIKSSRAFFCEKMLGLIAMTIKMGYTKEETINRMIKDNTNEETDFKKIFLYSNGVFYSITLNEIADDKWCNYTLRDF